MVIRSKAKARHPKAAQTAARRPTVEELMAMSDEDFRGWVRKIGLEDQIQRALKELDAAV
jgi:hypothetical protein